MPELSRRLRHSPLADWCGDLAIEMGDDKAMLAIDRGSITVKSTGTSDHGVKGEQEIAQLIVGSETPDEIVAMHDILLSGDAGQLIQVLFPIQYPQMENQAL